VRGLAVLGGAKIGSYRFFGRKGANVKHLPSFKKWKNSVTFLPLEDITINYLLVDN
jgi:hypothetical protein